MISTNDVRPGQALSLEGKLFKIQKYEHVKPGKGKAFVRMKLKNLETGQVMDRTFRAGEDVEQAIVDRSDHQYLYQDDLGYHFMNLQDYTQMAVSAELIDDAALYLKEGMTVVLPLYQAAPIGVELPAAVELEVTYAEPGIKGDRVSGATKPVTLETGLVVQAPLFIEEGDTIKVDTSSGSYITRV